MIELDLNILQQLGYIFSAILFIYGLKMLSNESTAARGNVVSSIGMLFAVFVTVIEIVNPVLVLSAVLLGALIGSAFALKVKMIIFTFKAKAEPIKAPSSTAESTSTGFTISMTVTNTAKSIPMELTTLPLAAVLSFESIFKP